MVNVPVSSMFRRREGKTLEKHPRTTSLPTRCSNPSDREMGVARLARFSWLWLLGKRTEELAVNMVNMPISPLFRTGEGNNLGKKNSNTSTLGVSPSTPSTPNTLLQPLRPEMGVARLVRFSWLWLLGETNRRTCCQHGEHANFILVPQKGREQPWEKHPSNTSTLGVSPSTPSTPNTLLQPLRPGDGRRSSGEAFMAVAVWGNEPKNLL